MYNWHDLEKANDVDIYIKLKRNKNFKYAIEFDDDLPAVNIIRANVRLDKFSFIGFAILERAKLFIYKTIFDSFEKELDCSYHSTDTDSIFIKTKSPDGSTFNNEMDKMKDILINTERGKMKDEIPNDSIIEACFIRAKAHFYTTVKRGEEKKLKTNK